MIDESVAILTLKKVIIVAKINVRKVKKKSESSSRLFQRKSFYNTSFRLADKE